MGVPKPAEYDILETGKYPALPVDSSHRTGTSLPAGATTHLAVEHNESLGRNGGKLYAEVAPGERRGIDTGGSAGSTFMTQPSTPSANPIAEGHELDSFLGRAFEEKPIWTELYDNVRDFFFPPKLPPLELTSTPIPVPDRMAVKTNPWAVGTAAIVNGVILAVILVFGARKIYQEIKKPALDATNIDISDFKAPKAQVKAGGGGGGGSHDLVDPTKGKLPKIDQHPQAPPMIPVVEKPKLAVDSAINVQKDIKLPDNPMLPMIGVHNSPNVTLASNGQGDGGGMGTGHGGGLGSGNGNGYGPGTGGNTGGGVYRVGGGISAPVPIIQPEAEFSDEARRAKYQGEVMISLIVDAQGNPQNPRVVRPLGMGLDEKALEAVRKYKFKPALKDGRTPVPVMVTIAVNFRLY
jgi:periplasmic protein TonB